MGELNPFRYRGYYYDEDTNLYYLQSRYYDPVTCKFINADDPTIIYQTAYNPLAVFTYDYCNGNPVMFVDKDGYAAINIICSAIGGLVGWYFGDFVAKKLGYKSGWKYWAIRSGVVIGRAVIGWFAGSAISKIIVSYLKSNPSITFKLINKWGISKYTSYMKFLGVNPFSLAKDSSKFIAIAKAFNSKSVTIGKEWAKTLYNRAKSLGYRIVLDFPHGGYGWHIHLSGANGKLKNLHIQITKTAYDFLRKKLR